jgi:hypothetical protein
MTNRALFWLAITICTATSLRADVGDPTVRTDHPQYAGEGAFQTVEDCVTFATQNDASQQDKALALYQWLLTHQWHLASPQEFNVPGARPDTQHTNQYELMVYDANRSRFSYGYGLCGTVHSWNEPYWKSLGMNVRRRAFPGHTNSEIEYGGSWHAFDTDMAGLIFRPDGVVAGYSDVIKSPTIATNAKPPIPCYPFAWPSDFHTMQSGWQQVAKGEHWYSMYHSGYAAHPGVVYLRAGETFTRYFDRDHFGGPTKRRFWHDQPGGPFRDWTFANQGQPQHDGETSNCRGNASYCNGEFVYRPDLSSALFRDGVVAQSENVSSREASPRLFSRDEKTASVIFSLFSPYVICGDPADDANPMTASATGGLTIIGHSVGPTRLSISADEGQTWHDVGEVTGPFERDLTDQVKGRYGWQARFEWSGQGGLDDVKFTTVTQVCQAIYPRLKSNGSTVVYKAASHAVVPVLPNFSLNEAEIGRFEAKSLRSPNVAYSPRSQNSRFAYRTTDNKPGFVVFHIDSPTHLTEVTAAVRFGVSVPPPRGCDFRLELSLDGGNSWLPLAKADIPDDNEYSSGWMFGRCGITDTAVKKALVRAHFYNGGNQTGLLEAQLYGLRRTSPPKAAQLTFGWKESGEAREFVESLPAGTHERTFTIPTGPSIVDDFVQLRTK